MSCSKALDIDNKELVLSGRQQRIERKLVKCYAKEIALIIARLVEENCVGCILGQLSQTQHECLTMQRDEQLWRYYDPCFEQNLRRKNYGKFRRKSKEYETRSEQS